jgi:hypothetical protein
MIYFLDKPPAGFLILALNDCSSDGTQNISLTGLSAPAGSLQTKHLSLSPKETSRAEHESRDQREFSRDQQLAAKLS